MNARRRPMTVTRHERMLLAMHRAASVEQKQIIDAAAWNSIRSDAWLDELEATGRDYRFLHGCDRFMTAARTASADTSVAPSFMLVATRLQRLASRNATYARVTLESIKSLLMMAGV